MKDNDKILENIYKDTNIQTWVDLCLLRKSEVETVIKALFKEYFDYDEDKDQIIIESDKDPRYYLSLIINDLNYHYNYSDEDYGWTVELIFSYNGFKNKTTDSEYIHISEIYERYKGDFYEYIKDNFIRKLNDKIKDEERNNEIEELAKQFCIKFSDHPWNEYLKNKIDHKNYLSIKDMMHLSLSHNGYKVYYENNAKNRPNEMIVDNNKSIFKFVSFNLKYTDEFNSIEKFNIVDPKYHDTWIVFYYWELLYPSNLTEFFKYEVFYTTLDDFINKDINEILEENIYNKINKKIGE